MGAPGTVETTVVGTPAAATTVVDDAPLVTCVDELHPATNAARLMIANPPKNLVQRRRRSRVNALGTPAS